MRRESGSPSFHSCDNSAADLTFTEDPSELNLSVEGANSSVPRRALAAGKSSDHADWIKTAEADEIWKVGATLRITSQGTFSGFDVDQHHGGHILDGR